MRTKPPPPFVRIREGGAEAWSRPEARQWVAEALASGRTLHRAAREDPDADLLPGGRGETVLLPTDGATWVVRHGHRGGMVAPLLGDRYLRAGSPRPFREARVSEEVRRRGISTPRVVAAAVYPAGPFYRWDLTTEFVPGGRPLSHILFGDDRSRDGEGRLRLLARAGRFPGRLARAGIHHRDLNLTNLFVTDEGGNGEIVLLDLDRCRVLPEGASGPERRMFLRLERSLRKLEGKMGPPLEPADREAFLEAGGGLASS